MHDTLFTRLLFTFLRFIQLFFPQGIVNNSIKITNNLIYFAFKLFFSVFEPNVSHFYFRQFTLMRYFIIVQRIVFHSEREFFCIFRLHLKSEIKTKLSLITRQIKIISYFCNSLILKNQWKKNTQLFFSEFETTKLIYFTTSLKLSSMLTL